MVAKTFPYGTNPVASNSSGSAALGMGLGSILGPIGGIAGNIIGGLFGRSGQESANRQNLQIAREQMAFQREMSSTAYQRSAADLEKAGLNRILALGKPASTPAGASATMQNKNAALARGMEQAAATAMQSAKLRQEIKESNSRIAVQEEQKWLTRAQTAESGGRGHLISQQAEESILRQAGIKTQNKIYQLDADIRALRIPGMQAEADLWRWLARNNIDEISKLVPDVGKALASVMRYYVVYMRNPGGSTPGGSDRFRRGN